MLELGYELPTSSIHFWLESMRLPQWHISIREDSLCRKNKSQHGLHWSTGAREEAGEKGSDHGRPGRFRWQAGFYPEGKGESMRYSLSLEGPDHIFILY